MLHPEAAKKSGQVKRTLYYTFKDIADLVVIFTASHLIVGTRQAQNFASCLGTSMSESPCCLNPFSTFFGKRRSLQSSHVKWKVFFVLV